MKAAKQIIPAVIAAAVIMWAFQCGTLDAADSASPAKIGVIKVTDVLENCQQHKDWQAKMQAERGEMEKEFTRMKTELEALQANLKLLTPGSVDYLKLQGDMLEKKALMEAKDEFYRGKVEAEMQRWTEELYQKLLKIVEKLAEDKGLDMVMTDESLDLPAPSLRDFMLTIKTKKMLYFNPKYDITTAALEAMNKTE